MQRILSLCVFLRLTLAAAGAVSYHQHDELDSFGEMIHHGHSHGEQIPLGYVKYPWLSPESRRVYPGDDDGK